MARLTRREMLRAGLAAVPAAALARWDVPGALSAQAAAQEAVLRRSLGFPIAASQWHGDSSVGAAIRAGLIAPNSPLDAVVRDLRGAQRPAGSPSFDDDIRAPRPREPRVRIPIPPPAPTSAERLRARYRDLRRHFVFEYYPWYQTSPVVHWDAFGHVPPYDIASTMMPALGPYDSKDAKIVEQHARWMAEAGIGAVAISWWGQDSYTNQCVPLIMDVMRAHDIHVTFHLEPYRDDRARFYADDVRYLLREYGERRRWDAFLLLEHADGSASPVFKTFRTIVPPTIVDCKGRVQPVPDYVLDSEWRRQTDTIRQDARPSFDRVVLLADSLDLGRTVAGGFDGIAIYDSYVRPSTWPSAAGTFGGNNLLFSFAVNCGFDEYLAVISRGECDFRLPFEPPVGPIDWTSAASRDKAIAASRGRVLESWQTTIDLQADAANANWKRGFFLTYVNTFNEWHEGTAFEPARHLADLLPQERPFGYHNPPNGAWRLELVRSLMAPLRPAGLR